MNKTLVLEKIASFIFKFNRVLVLLCIAFWVYMVFTSEDEAVALLQKINPSLTDLHMIIITVIVTILFFLSMFFWAMVAPAEIDNSESSENSQSVEIDNSESGENSQFVEIDNSEADENSQF